MKYMETLNINDLNNIFTRFRSWIRKRYYVIKYGVPWNPNQIVRYGEEDFSDLFKKLSDDER